MNLDEQIEEQTKLIAELESSYPEYHPEAGRYSRENHDFEVHFTKVRDAYWRRRMLIAKKEGLDLNEVAKVY